MPLQVPSENASLSSLTLTRRYGWLIACVASIGALMFGFDIAIISGAAPYLQRYFALNNIELGWAVSSLLLGCTMGSGVAGKLAQAYGRRSVLIAIALLFTASSIGTGIASNFTFFVFARFVGGVAVGAASMISPMYVAEIAPSDTRGQMVSLCQLGVTIGIVISYLINYSLRNTGATNWRWMFFSGAVPSVAFFLLLFSVPESPRWLFSEGREDLAFSTLVRLGGLESAVREMAQMRSAAPGRAHTNNLTASRHRRVMLVGISLAILIQLCGMNAVISYAPIVLSRAGNRIDTALFQTFIVGAVNLIATFLAVFMVDRIGRRTLYMSGSAGMLASLLLIAASFSFPSIGGYYGLLFILLFVASFAACVGPVFWILMSELFPTAIRASAMSAAVLITWSVNFAVILVFPWVFAHLGPSATFYAVAVVPLMMCLIAWKYLPETKGLSLEEVDEFWKQQHIRTEENIW